MLASGFSHEMNTPLATVLTCIESIIRETGADNDPGLAGKRIDESASIAREQILRCKGITQHFLRLSRGQSSPGALVDVGSLVEAVSRLVQSTAKSRGVVVRSEGPLSTASVRADEADLQHAVMNLLINAIEASGPDGVVSVQVVEDSSVHIRVTDTGQGIPEDQLGRIFEPFVSLTEGGTGLGLFLALNFVRQWGGDILVRSTLDRGSVFEILLPSIGEETPAEAHP